MQIIYFYFWPRIAELILKLINFYSNNYRLCRYESLQTKLEIREFVAKNYLITSLNETLGFKIS
jgi:hypothetical protein